MMMLSAVLLSFAAGAANARVPDEKHTAHLPTALPLP
jgi:hypothetical protein